MSAAVGCIKKVRLTLTAILSEELVAGSVHQAGGCVPLSCLNFPSSLCFRTAHTRRSSSFPLLSFLLQRTSGQRGPAGIGGGSIHFPVNSPVSLDFVCSSVFTATLVGNSSSKFAAIWPSL